MKISAVGIMSGTSLDGLDLCRTHFIYDTKWRFEIVETAFIEYDKGWKSVLENAHLLDESKLSHLDIAYGVYIGEQVNQFLAKKHLTKPDLVCSHGHTVFHKPAEGITLQIGDGASIANLTTITCISDFRSLDVSLGGQGAPLVPIGDELLFSEYDACLNLGGFSNISFSQENLRLAFDVCPVNIALNPLANLLGLSFDKGGEIARSNTIDQNLLEELNSLPLYAQIPRQSLSREWLEDVFIPLVAASQATTELKIASITEHAAFQIASIINSKAKNGQILVTGGGAKNTFLIERIKALSQAEIVVPTTELVDFKEALIFGFLGVLKWLNQINVLQSVTGANRDSSSGIVSFPVKN